MRLSAVLVARYFAFIEPVDLNPSGRIHYPSLASALVERYGFIKFPQKSEDFDESKGVLFEGGKLGDVGNIRIQVFANLIMVETAASTRDSERILEDALAWGAEKLGFTYHAGMIRRKTYLSQLTLYSDAKLNTLNPALARLSQRLSKRVPEYFGQQLEYETTGVYFGFDPTKQKFAPSFFIIDRRADTPFSENKYWSQAPLPTDEHIEALEQFEADILASR